MGLDTLLLQDGFAGDLTTLRALQLCCRMTDAQAAEYCMVSPETYRRWGKDRQPSPAAVRLMAIRAGYVPWPGWDNWEVHSGRLFPPGFTRNGVSAGEIQAMPYFRQLLAEYERQVRAFQAMADQADTPPMDPAAIQTVIGGGK